MARDDEVQGGEEQTMINYLDSPLALVLGLMIGSALAAFWLLVEPYTKKHRAVAFYIDIMFAVEAVTVPLMLLAQSQWRQPILDNIWYNFVAVRVSTNPTTAHTIPYVCVFLSYFIYQRTFYSNWKSCLSVLLLVFTHEGLWFLFAIPVGLVFGFWGVLNYMILLSMMLVTYHIKYKLNRNYILYFVLPILVYDIIWYLVGFPVTVRSYLATQSQMYPTELWGDLMANAIEVFSWLYAIATSVIWAYSIRDIGPRPPKLKFVIKRQWW